MAWTIWIDSLSNQRAKGAKVLLRSPEGDTIECVVRLWFLMANNKAKYNAVLSGLDLAKATGAKSTVIHCNSQVVVRHINGDYAAKGEQMKEYLSMIKSKMGEQFLVNSYKSQGKRTNKQTIWPKQHPSSIQTSPVKYYPLSNILLQLIKWKYRSSP